MLSRRKFIGIAGGVGAAGAAGGAALWSTLLSDHVDEAVDQRDVAGAGAQADSASSTTTVNSKANRVLVVLQLSGGNDGLNTLIPSDGRYRDARTTLAIPEAELVGINAAGYSLHPSLAALAPLWNTGMITALEGVGMKDQSRSHFKAMDTWWSATPGAASQTGWLGRWLDATENGKAPNPLRAIALGGGSPALVGVRALPTVVMAPAEFSIRTPRGCDAKTLTDAFLATAQPLVGGNDVFAAAQQSFPDTLEAIDLLQKVRAQASGQSATVRNGAQGATALLQSAAGIIEQGIGTQVVLVAVNGFDTHADQLDRQSALLSDVGDGIAQFVSRIQKAGKADDVLLITTSEFGRRVAENASVGTDHGNGNVSFVVGTGINGGKVVGDLGLGALVDGDVPVSIDTRSLYSVALDWLGGPADSVLGGNFDRYAILR
ncbi:MAG: DUF1501 domain-containing protein [Acidimicrobiales bacterium]